MDFKKITIVTGPLAPYRLDLYNSLGHLYDGEATIDVIYGQKVQMDHQWSNLLDDSRFYQLNFVSCLHFPKWIATVLRCCKLGKGNPRLPSLTMWKALKESNPDVIWISEVNPYTMIAYLYAKIKRKKLWLATELGATNHLGDANFFTKHISGIGAKFVDHILACCPHATRTVWKHKNEVIFVPHAVRNDDYLAFRAVHEHKEVPVILLVGNCIYRKGVDLLIAALSELKKDNVRFHLRAIGGADTEWLSDSIEEFGLSENISFVGFLEGDDLKNEYANADLFVLSSRHDTYAVVTHEAAICGLPLVISKHAGSSEVLVNEKNGYVIDPEDKVEFAEKMKTFLTSASRRKEAGEASIELASSCGVDENARIIKDKLSI